MKRSLLVILAFAVLGCVSDVSHLKLAELCGAHVAKLAYDQEAVRARLRELGYLEDWEWRLVDERKIKVGMTECALLASWGWPDDVNSSSHGPEQWVYSDPGGIPRSFVYIERGGGPACAMKVIASPKAQEIIRAWALERYPPGWIDQANPDPAKVAELGASMEADAELQAAIGRLTARCPFGRVTSWQQ